MTYDDLQTAIGNFAKAAILPKYSILERIPFAMVFESFIFNNRDRAVDFLKQNKLIDDAGNIDHKRIMATISEYVFLGEDSIPLKIADKEFYIRKEHLEQIIANAMSIGSK